MTRLLNHRFCGPFFRGAVLVSIGAAFVLAFSGCGSSATAKGSSHVFTTAQAKRLLLELPYTYSFRRVPLPEGASGALGGRVFDQHHTFVNFGIALGRDLNAVPVPGSGTEQAYGYPAGGFIYTDDIIVDGDHGRRMLNPRLHTTREFHDATDISVAIEEKLCRAATGEPCHEG